MDRAAGPGDDRAAGVAGDVVVIYTVCNGGKSVRVRTDFPRVAPQQVPCDGVVSRAQIYTEQGRSFRAEVGAPSATAWQLLVTRRSE